MFRIKIDLVPGGFEPNRHTIAEMNITNVSDLADVSDYRVEGQRGPKPPYGKSSAFNGI